MFDLIFDWLAPASRWIEPILRESPMGEYVRSSQWAWPVLESLHFFGMSLLIGTVGVFDLRLMGFARGIPYAALHRLIPIGISGFILNASTGQPYARVVPDILVERSTAETTARLAIDAKYKLYDERKRSSSDVYQSFLYAYAYGAAGGPALPAALLVYPSSSRSSRAVRLRVRSAQALAAAEILALGLSIPDVLAELTGQIHGSATKALIEAVQQGIGADRHVAA